MDIADITACEAITAELRALSLLWEAKVPKRKRKGFRPVSIESSGKLVFLRLERNKPGRTKLIPKAVLTSSVNPRADTVREFFFREKQATYLRVCAPR